MKRLTTEEFKKRVYDLVEDEYTVLGEYKNIHTKILMKHNKCGNEWMTNPTSFIFRNSRCPECNQNIQHHKKTTEQFKKDVYDLVGDEYTVLGEYIDNKTDILIKCNKDNYTFEVKPTVFLASKGKNVFYRNNRYSKNNKNLSGKKITTEQFKKRVYDLVGDEFIVLGEYTKSKTKILLMHNCGKKFYITPESFSKTQVCPLCKSKENNYKNKIKKLKNGEYKVLNRKNRNNFIYLHEKCKCIFNLTRSSFDYINNYCPICNPTSHSDNKVIGYKREGDIFLYFDENLENLVGQEFGHDTYISQLLYQDIDVHKKFTLIFEDTIKDVSTSFLSGLFRDIIKEIGYEGIEKNLYIKSNNFNKDYILKKLIL